MLQEYYEQWQKYRGQGSRPPRQRLRARGGIRIGWRGLNAAVKPYRRGRRWSPGLKDMNAKDLPILQSDREHRV